MKHTQITHSILRGSQTKRVLLRRAFTVRFTHSTHGALQIITHSYLDALSDLSLRRWYKKRKVPIYRPNPSSIKIQRQTTPSILMVEWLSHLWCMQITKESRKKAQFQGWLDIDWWKLKAERTEAQIEYLEQKWLRKHSFQSYHSARVPTTIKRCSFQNASREKQRRRPELRGIFNRKLLECSTVEIEKVFSDKEILAV